MFENWFKENRKLKLLSQTATFLIALFSILSFVEILRAISYNPDALIFQKTKVITSCLFHIVIASSFAFRFVLLFFSSKKTFMISQIVWLICVLTLISFHIFTRFALYGGLFPPESDISFGMDHYPILFLYAENSFIILIFFYIFASPIKQIITLIMAKFKSK